jgi:hypothetical protein
MSRKANSETDLIAIQAGADRIARLMDELIVIPGTRIGIGWDAILGIVPGAGDLVSLISHLFLAKAALRAGVRKRIFVKMFLNAMIDLIVGVVPVVGDILDIFWKANRKNSDLLRREIAARARERR